MPLGPSPDFYCPSCDTFDIEPHTHEKSMNIRLIDNLHPEDLAMLQALYSRSAEGVDTHLKKLAETGSGNFMKSYYVGYNHKSIADCGSTTFFIEGVSLLAAKAIQDWPLYSGQETSTRYIDMSKQPIINPLGTDKGQAILNELVAFYTAQQEPVAAEVRRRYPQREGETNKAYEGAVKARTFDILRGFLPAGITTQLSWHTNLRQADDHLVVLRRHPAPEISDIARMMTDVFVNKYPSTGSGEHAGLSGVIGGREARAAWEEKYVFEAAYPGAVREDTGLDPDDDPGVYMDYSLSLRTDVYKDMLGSRPRGALLPHYLTDLGLISFYFYLDFGSFRDLQRHRNGVCRMPLLTTRFGFETWYLDQLDNVSIASAQNLLRNVEEAIAGLDCNQVVAQYYTPIGYRVPVSVTYGLPAAVYVMELRSSKTVHPTLRKKVHDMIEEFENVLPDVALHVDRDPDAWTVRRGTQTIEAKSL